VLVAPGPGVTAAAGTDQQSLSAADTDDLRPLKRQRRARVPFAAAAGQFTGRLAGQASRAQRDLASSQSGLEDELTDTDMQDSDTGGVVGEQASMPQLTPRALFPSLGGRRHSHSKPRTAAGSRSGGFSSKLAGSSSHVPNLSTYLGLNHAVADQGE
jgi:hypothetical protein